MTVAKPEKKLTGSGATPGERNLMRWFKVVLLIMKLTEKVKKVQALSKLILDTVKKKKVIVILVDYLYFIRKYISSCRI